MQRTTLKAGDIDISFVAPTDLATQPHFSLKKYTASLKSQHLGQTLLVASSLPSTQTFLHQNFASLPNGIICTADTQTSGKGNDTTLVAHILPR